MTSRQCVTDETQQKTCSTYFSLLLLGVGTGLSNSAIWVELPALTKRLPEGENLSLFLLVLLQAGNLSTVVYLLVRRCSYSGHVSEVPPIYGCIGFGIGSLIALAFFWSFSIDMLSDVSTSYSIVFLLCGFFAALVSCLAPVTFIPFSARFRPQYVTAILFGDAVGHLLPHILGIAQGVTQSPACDREAVLQANNNTAQPELPYSRYNRYHHFSTTPAPVALPPVLRFSESQYFFITAGIMCLSGVAFLFLRFVPRVRFDYSEQRVECPEDQLELAVDTPQAASPSIYPASIASQSTQAILCDDSYRQIASTPNSKYLPLMKPLNNDSGARPRDNGASLNYAHRSHYSADDLEEETRSPLRCPRSCMSKSQSNIERERYPARDNNALSTHFQDISTRRTRSSRTVETLSDKPPSYILLMVITLWSSAIIHGPLSSVKGHACLPAGNNRFMVGSVLSNIMIMFTCVLGIKMSPIGKVPLVVAITALGTILLTYFVALIAFSHTSQSREDSPIFGATGELLAVSYYSVTISS